MAPQREEAAVDLSSDVVQIIIALAAGIALSASCGFRVFVPPLIVSIASMLGMVNLSPDLAWMGTWPAALAFGSASLIEVAAYYIPALDNLLDTISVPVATIAGTLLTAAVLGVDIPAAARWILAVVAGGGTALAVSSGTAAVRGASTVTTAGLANPLVSTGELAASAALSVLSIALPILALAIVVVLVVVLVRWRRRRSVAVPVQQSGPSTQG